MGEKIKLSQIEIKSFRGIKDFSYKFNGNSLVICGPNGSGKSSIIQAFEYLFTDGVAALQGIQELKYVPSLIHKGDTKEDLLVKARINNQVIERSFNKFNPGNLEEMFDDFKNGSFILNRKKLLSFIESIPSQKYKQITGLISYEKYDDIEKNLNDAYKEIKKELEFSDGRINRKYETLTNFYNCEISELQEKINDSLKKNNLKEISETTDLKQYIDDNKLNPPHKLLTYNLDEINNKYLKVLDEYEEISLNQLKASNTLLSLLKVSKDYLLAENPDKCPICQNEIDSEEIIDDMNPKIDEIENNIKSFKEWESKSKNLISDFSKLNDEIKDFNTQNPQNNIDYDLNGLIKSLEGLSNFDKKVSEIDREIIKSLNNEILDKKDQIESNSEEINKALDNLLILKDIREEKKENEKINTQFNVALKTFTLFKDTKQNELKNILKKIEARTKEYYKYIHENDDIIDPKMETKGSKGLKLTLFFDDEDSDPRSYSSEGHIDTLGLCLFLAFAKEFNKYNFLILDDIISTVDMEHKEQVINLLFDKFGDYTFIITTHNRLWFEQLTRIAGYRKNGKFDFLEITDWNKKIGPTYSPKIKEREQIEKYINENDFFAAGNALRRHLEYVLDKICRMNRIYLPLKKSYTVFDYYEPAKSFSKKMFENTNFEKYYLDVFEELELSCYKANLLSHNNDENYDFNKRDVTSLRDAVYKFEEAFTCEKHKNQFLKFDRDKTLGICHQRRCNEFFKFEKIE